MMNHLNSVLVEGTIFTKPSLNNKGFCSFEVLSSKVYETSNGTLGRQDLYVPVVASGELAKKICSMLSEGAMVRIVGKLMQQDFKNHSGLTVYANHLEYRMNRQETSVISEAE